MTKKLKVYCPYSALDLEWGTLKNLQNITFEKPWYLKETVMTQEDKELLLKDLSVRLPYGVYVEHITTKIRGNLRGIVFEHIYNDTDSIQDINAWVMFFGDEYVDATYFRPFLRPMSNMTEEEENEYYNIEFGFNIHSNKVDWLNAHHFDHHGLIEKSLAIEVTEKNNPYK